MKGKPLTRSWGQVEILGVGTAAAPDWLRERGGEGCGWNFKMFFLSTKFSSEGRVGRKFQDCGLYEARGSGASCKTLGEVEALLNSVYMFKIHFMPYGALHYHCIYIVLWKKFNLF